MPHIIIKLLKGKSEEQKKKLAEEIVKTSMPIVSYGEEAFSVTIEDIEPKDWREKVYKPEIIAQKEKLYKEPGYKM
jgi:4-oxalocrotonate tautomerase